MGKIVGLAPSSISGSVGQFTFRQTKDGIIVSEKVKAKGISNRTLRQCMSQMRMANLMHLFKSFGGALNRGFENIPQNQNTQNAFIKANFDSVPVYLLKAEVGFGACVATPVQITRGSLPSIVVTNNAIPHTDIVLGNLVIDANTTIAAFSQAVIANPGYLNGDQISFFSLIQGSKTFGDYQGVPVVTNNRYEVTLDVTDTARRLYDLIGAYGFATVADGGVNYLGCSAAPAVGCYAWVHSRETNNGLVVSTQFLENNNAAVISQYSGMVALEKSANSYGGYKAVPFLMPDVSGSSVAVSGGVDQSTGAVFSGVFSVAAGSASANNSTANRTQLTAGAATVTLRGTNMGSYAGNVVLRMYDSANGSSYTDVAATRNAGSSTSEQAVYDATLVSPNLYLGEVRVNGSSIKTYAAVGGGTNPGGGGYDGD